MSRPRPYDLADPDEIRRLLYETRGYLRVSLDHGTDREGREHALSGLNALIDEADPLKGAGGEVRAFCESFVSDFEMDFGTDDYEAEARRAWTLLAPLYRLAKAALDSAKV